jgi:hypothetical protein
VAAAYTSFGLPFSTAAEEAMQALQASNAGRPAAPAHRYTLADFGLTGAEVDERFPG